MSTFKDLNLSVNINTVLNTSIVEGSDAQIWVSGISEDSRKVESGDLFVARMGGAFNGADYIEQAAENGAVAAIIDASFAAEVDGFSIPVFPVDNFTSSIGDIAAAVYSNVVDKVQVIGVTGTNGKTSCAHFLAQALNRLGLKTYMIGTLGNGDPFNLDEAERTTPDACALHRLIADYYAKNVKVVVMEVSSHALEQGRVVGIPFSCAAFTNLSRDHLDYHGSMQAYGAAKLKLFTDFDPAHKVFNLDDDFISGIYNDYEALYPQSIASFAEKNANAAVRVEDVAINDSGLVFNLITPIGKTRVATLLLGKFNLSNLLLTATVLYRLGFSLEDIQCQLEQLQPVPGRIERVHLKDIDRGQQPLCIVDYAHTPDALEKVLIASRIHCKGRLIVVFGCGGDRDNGKRIEMAAVAQEHADVSIVTSDNPRTENPDRIIEMIVQGFKSKEEYNIIADRKNAIFSSIASANVEDVVVIAGKGHENYQEIMGVKHPFLDSDIAEAALLEKSAQGNTEL